MKKELGSAIQSLCFLCLVGFWIWVVVTGGKQPQEFVRQYFLFIVSGPTATPRPTPTPNYLYWFDKGVDNLFEGRYQQAIEDFDETVRLNPDFAPAYSERGVAKGSLQLNEEAILDYSRSIELDPSRACTFHNRGVARYNLDQFEQALTYLDFAIKLRSRYDEAYTSRGWAKFQFKQYESAKDDFDEAIGMRSVLDSGSKIKLCPAEEAEPRQRVTPTPGSALTSGSTPTPNPTSTPNPCPSACFSNNEARFISTYLGRAYAYFHLGDNQAALADAETALEMAQEYGDNESAESAQSLINAIK